MFQGMRYIFEVYKEMSFSKAAKNLYISQPSLSSAVKKVEQQVGFPIFDRSTNPITLTELGREYIRSASMILDVENGFKNYVAETKGLHIGSLSIGATNLFASYVLPPILSKFTECYPAIHIELVEGTTAELTERLANGAIDLLIENTDLDESLYEKRSFCMESLLLTVPASLPVNDALRNYAMTSAEIKSDVHLNSRILPVPLHYFKDQLFILLSSGNDTRKRADQLCNEAGFAPIIRLETEQQVTAYNMSSYGMGISFCGDMLIHKVPSVPDLVFYKLNQPESTRNVAFYFRKKRYLTQAMQAFLELL